MKEIAWVFQDNPVRMLVLRGEPWWVAKDVCDVLGIVNSRDALSSLEVDEKGVAITDTLGGKQEVQTVNESGLYSLIFRSRKPEAKEFRHWVTSEVLPSIRKTGQYSVTIEARKESAAARSALCRQWQEHGARMPYHFINLTRAEYKTIFGDSTKRKADMTREELAILMVLESVEYLKLIKNQQITGYRQLADSLHTTAKQLPLFTTMSLEGANA